MTTHTIPTGSGLSAADDRFHFDTMSDRWWETETCWFSFHDVERALGGWVYVMVRPNIGTVAGGAWIWDSSAHLPWEVLYSSNYTSLRLPRDQDLDDIELPTGVGIKMRRPLTEYDVTYADEDRLSLDLRFAAVMEPQVLSSAESSYGHSAHFDQAGRVVGTMRLHGEEIPIDCYAMRDRSWGPRPEHRPRRTAYVTAVADDRNSFLAVTSRINDRDVLRHGFLCRDGDVLPAVSGERRVVRDPQRGWVTRVEVDLADEGGRTLTAVGTPVSRIILNRISMIDCNSLLRWTLDDGVAAVGEDQDLWPVHEWSSARRGSR